LGTYGCGFGSGQWLSLFWLDLDSSIAPVKVVDAKFIVVADAIGQGTFELWVQGCEHGESQNDCRFQIELPPLAGWYSSLKSNITNLKSFALPARRAALAPHG
jgi:hypothetical protein